MPVESGLGDWVTKLRAPPDRRREFHIHLVGIGGAGLSAIARYLLEMGYTVSGSDQRLNDATVSLASLGAVIHRGHSQEYVAGADLVLISSAVAEGNPEATAALRAGTPVLKRSDFLGPLIEGKHGIGVAGSHGKTTTTSMIAIILTRAGLDPSFIIGGSVPVGPAEGLPSGEISAKAGQGPFVIEADEYDRMFLGLRLESAVVTNVDWDHVDCYPSPQDFAEAFRDFVGQLPAHGLLVPCADDPSARALAGSVGDTVAVWTYGLGDGADWQARALVPNALGGLDADILREGVLVAHLSLPIPGRHNIRNALAAVAVACWHGIEPAWAATMLRDFRGANRRFTLVGEAGGVLVIDDYAHHPTEVAATLSAARLRYPTRRIWAVFQPHTYSRTKALEDRFARSFDDADRVLVLDIYAAREKDDLGLHPTDLVARIDHPAVEYAGGPEASARLLESQVEPGDVVITMSAGDGNVAGRLLLDALGNAEGDRPRA